MKIEAKPSRRVKGDCGKGAMKKGSGGRVCSVHNNVQCRLGQKSPYETQYCVQ